MYLTCSLGAAENDTESTKLVENTGCSKTIF